MTKVVFRRDKEDMISSVDILGHAGYADEGEDIVCAAITSAVQLTHIILDDVLGLVFDTVVEQEGAHISIYLSDDVREAGQNALCALQMHYREMQENYPEFIQVTEV